jgi:signal transduction histidine kinase
MLGVRTRSPWRRPAPGDFRRVFEALPDAVLIVRADAPRFTIAAVSDAYLRATHTRRGGGSGIVGRAMFDVFPPAPNEAAELGMRTLRASLERVIRTGVTDIMSPQQYDIRRPDGSWEERHWSPKNVPVRDANGAVDYVIHEVVDVTESMRLDQRLSDAERASAAAQEANAMKTRFLAEMSHELRTPLNSIGGYVDLITMGIHGPLTDQQRDALDRIRRSEQHLLGLINEVLSYAKIESGRIVLERRRSALGEILDDVVRLLTPQLEAKQLRLTRGPTAVDGCELEVVADPEKAHQVLVNLLSNAVKFTGAGGAISIDCDADRDWVRVTVRDTGVGIREEDLARVFEPFVQVGSAKSAAEGTGLGLSISRELARAMGGDVTLSSVVGRGSSFTLRLPRATNKRERRSA